MLHHKRLRPPAHDYVADEWHLIEKSFHPEFLAQMETVLAWAAMVLCVFTLTVPYPMGADDTFLQITTGEYILAHGIPHRDPFSYTATDHPYAEHEWLTCVLFALTYRWGGVAGMVALKAVIIGATCLLVVQTARTLGASWSVIVLVFGPLVYVVASRVIERLFATAVALTLGLRLHDPQCGAKLFRNTPAMQVLFQLPFRTRWLWDVELLARMQQARQQTGLPPVAEVFYEYPLDRWQEVPGSHITPRNLVTGLCGLRRLAWDARR